MKGLNIALGLLFVGLQYHLWFADDRLMNAWRTHHLWVSMRERTQAIQAENALLLADVQDLKQGREAVEERARAELGLVKTKETYYRILD